MFCFIWTHFDFDFDFDFVFVKVWKIQGFGFPYINCHVVRRRGCLFTLLQAQIVVATSTSTPSNLSLSHSKLPRVYYSPSHHFRCRWQQNPNHISALTSVAPSGESHSTSPRHSKQYCVQFARHKTVPSKKYLVTSKQTTKRLKSTSDAPHVRQ